jgi:GNAT superfamily N-acetyltransferase
MPIQVQAIHDIKDVLIRNQIERLYDISPEFIDGQDAIEQLDQALSTDTTLYTANFNDKIIGAVWCIRLNVHSCLLNYVVIHPANRGRSVAERLVAELCRLEEAQGVQEFQPGCGATFRCLQHLAKLPRDVPQ